jgi:hypothetical protein
MAGTWMAGTSPAMTIVEVEAAMSQDLAKRAADYGIRYFLIGFVDLFGVLRAKLVPAAAIGQMQKDGAAFAGFATHLDLTPADPVMFAPPRGSIAGSLKRPASHEQGPKIESRPSFPPFLREPAWHRSGFEGSSNSARL